MKKLLFSALALLSFSLKAQTQAPCDSANWAKENTFEIISTSKVKEVFTKDILCLIEANRHDEKVIEIQISSMSIIRIYPRNKLNLHTSPQ